MEIYFILTFIIIVALWLYYSYLHIIILSNTQLKNLLIDDDDNYYSTFEIKDFEVRNVRNIKEYKEKIKNMNCNIDEVTQQKLINSIYLANDKLKKMKQKYNKYNEINIQQLINIKWVIGVTCNKIYENDIPHTRKHVIIFSKEQINNSTYDDLANTLIHEKVHIYQKIYKEDVQNFIKNNNYKIYKKNTHFDNIRANPDTDNYVYMKNKIFKASYIPFAKTMNDVLIPNNDFKNEHPMELMAIQFEEKCKNL